MNPKSSFHILSRPDKWYLGGGNRLLYAPPFPRFLNSPGIWDDAHYYNYAFGPQFTWAILVEGKAVSLELAGSAWRPDMLVRTFRTRSKGDGLVVEERSALLPTDVLVSEISVKNRASRPVRASLVAWTVRESHLERGISFVRPLVEEGIFSCELTLSPVDRTECRFGSAFSVAGSRVHHRILMSEGSAPPPVWLHTPFAESGGIAGSKGRGEAPVAVSEGVLFAGFETFFRLRKGSSTTFRLGSAAAPSPLEARANLSAALGRRQSPIQLSTLAWNDHFDSVPQFSASDPFLQTAYWYRWYGMKLNTIYGGEGNYEYPAVCEGIGYFRAPISYSAPCHMLENRWMQEPELARGSLLTFIHNQRDDGGFRGYIDVNTYRQEMFYHANWGRSLLAVEAIHPSDDFLRQAYDGLKKYAAYFDRERDEEVSGLYDIDNHYETGQEYMRRYTAVNPKADEDNWGEVFRLKGVDVTVYLYELKRALATVAERLGLQEEASAWTVEANRTKEAILGSMWDPKDGMFYDVDPATGKRTRVKAATCFYPYFTDIVGKEHLPGMKEHLFSKKEFWAPWPLPSTSMDDPSFSAEPVWKGKRMNCPWNGRVWPMTNSHIMEAIATTALRFDDAMLEKKAVEFLTKYIRMMFDNGDPSRPNCYEHYNPLTGTASVYRGVNDYMHSWVNDLILKYVMGIQIGLDEVRIRPLRMGLKRADVKNVVIRGRKLDVEVREKGFFVRVDGRGKLEEQMGRAIELQI